MRVDLIANMGAYYYFYAPYIPTGAALKVLPGVYAIPCLSYGVKGVFTNTVPIDAYRGAGRPESIYCIERLIEAAARELKVDPTELRRINFVRPEQMPFDTAAGETYDSGDFARVMDSAKQRADWDGVAARRAAARARGKRVGVGMCYYIESTMGDPTEHAAIRFEDDGTVSVLVGTQTNGQGHDTAYAQVLHQRLGVPFERIRIVQGDTAQIKAGGGTGGSRSLTAQGMAICDASTSWSSAARPTPPRCSRRPRPTSLRRRRVPRRRHRPRHRHHGAGRARARRDRGRPGGCRARRRGDDEAERLDLPERLPHRRGRGRPDTGNVDIARYTVVDDFGVVVNPMLVEGQVHGGIVQGLGQALLEGAVYDDGGQLLTGSFMDYAMPRADNMPSFDFSTVEVPCKNNALGVKGCGEAGSVGSPAAVINAVIDALADLGVRHVDMPATPQRLWELMHQHRHAAAA
jgi:carbon-monoxide dehydrogenase large subunit